MEKKFIVTTDSASDSGRENLKEMQIDFISYNFTDGTNAYVDSMDREQNKWFYDQMRKGVVFKTSQLSVEEYKEFFLTKKDEHLPIIHVSLCEGLSNSVNNARLAAIELKKKGLRATIVDATVGCLGIHMIAKEAARLRDEGVEYEEAIDYLNDKAKCVNTFFTTNDLTYFARGGRLSKGAAFFSRILNINVILTTDKVGHLTVSSKFRGRKKAFEQIVKNIKKLVINPEEQTLQIISAENVTGMNELTRLIMLEIPFKDYEEHEMGPTIGAHAGPGLISVFFFGKEK